MSTIAPELKIEAVLEYQGGTDSVQKLAKKYGTSRTSVQRWIRLYDTFGESGFYQQASRSYPLELKQLAVNAYLAGEGSLESLCERYEIQCATQLRRWILKYTVYGKVSFSRTGGTSLNEGRSTTLEERIEIAEYCIEHNHNYSETAAKFSVSYQQARSYTVKYEEGGSDALQDRRGKKKPEDSLTEVERLKAELRREKALRRKAEMEVSFLKKLKEIEGRRN